MGFIEHFLADLEWPEIPNFMHILDLWNYSDQAGEVTGFFNQLFSRLPPYFLAFFALCFFFIVIPLIVSMLEKIL